MSGNAYERMYSTIVVANTGYTFQTVQFLYQNGRSGRILGDVVYHTSVSFSRDPEYERNYTASCGMPCFWGGHRAETHMRAASTCPTFCCCFPKLTNFIC